MGEDDWIFKAIKAGEKGQGRGNWGHEGRPGQVGGSAPSGSTSTGTNWGEFKPGPVSSHAEVAKVGVRRSLFKRSKTGDFNDWEADLTLKDGKPVHVDIKIRPLEKGQSEYEASYTFKQKRGGTVKMRPDVPYFSRDDAIDAVMSHLLEKYGLRE